MASWSCPGTTAHARSPFARYYAGGRIHVRTEARGTAEEPPSFFFLQRGTMHGFSQRGTTHESRAKRRPEGERRLPRLLIVEGDARLSRDSFGLSRRCATRSTLL